MSKIKSLFLITTSLFSISSSLFAEEVAFRVNNISAFPLQSQKLGLKLNYNRINDTIDIFDIKQKELGDINKFGTIGDSSGIDLSVGYGINEFVSLNYNYEYLDIEYIKSNLTNTKNEIFAKVNLFQNPMNFFEVFSIDLGFIRNHANDIEISDPDYLTAMINKINPIPGLTIENGQFKYKGSTISFSQPGTNKPLPVAIQFTNMTDNSTFIRFLTGMRHATHIMDLYAGLKYTSLDTDIQLLPQNFITQSAQASLGRNEKTAFFGFNYTGEFNPVILDINYEYLTIWGREDTLKETENNHIINASISFAYNQNLLFFVGGKLMLHQFNGVIPYLYNKYTKTKYDKKYGYAKIGLIYNFDTAKLFNSLPTEYTSY